MDEKAITSRLIDKYDERFGEFGDSHLAVGWPSEANVQKRHEIMLEVVGFRSLDVSLLDYGCGLGHFYDFILPFPASDIIKYSGVDINPTFITACREKYPSCQFYNTEDGIPLHDYVIMNGLFTEKLNILWWDFWQYAQSTIIRAWDLTKTGLAVNFMSTYLDHEREDLFHLPLDTLAHFIHRKLKTRNFTIRHDYNLWEYTVYVYR